MSFLAAESIHFTGIKGVGMTALAGVAADMGKTVSGSDTAEIFPTDDWLSRSGIRVSTGFRPDHVPENCRLLVYTGAHGGADNPEVVAAGKRGLPVLNYARALAEVTAGKTLVATAGVGGKSTTAGLLATIMETAGSRPSWVIGVGGLKPLNDPGRWRRESRIFVAETDEFSADPGHDPTPKFHYLQPTVAVVTNIAHDHPDIYPTINDVLASFRTFVAKLAPDGVIIAGGDSPVVSQWLKDSRRPRLTYGFSPLADWRIIRHRTAAEKQLFSLQYRQVVYPDLVLNLPGKHNLLNAAAAFAAAHFLGFNPDKISAGLKAFTGAKRRFELIADRGGIRLYDDYAHHPLEIEAVLAAARDWLPGRRLVVVFQSHTYSRTRALLRQFAASLSAADAVIVNEIFASARETDTLGVSGLGLARAVQEHQAECYFASGEAETLERLVRLLRPGDAVFTLGAGNNWLWHKQIIKLMKPR